MKIKLALMQHETEEKKLSLDDMYEWDVLEETFLVPFADVKYDISDTEMSNFDYSFIKLVYISPN